MVRPVGRVAGRERPQAERRQQRGAARVDDAPRQLGLARERPVRQRHGEQLVGPHVTHRRPEGRRPRRAGRARRRGRSGATNELARRYRERASRRDRRPPSLPAMLERLDPERVHLDRLAPPRRHRHARRCGRPSTSAPSRRRPARSSPSAGSPPIPKRVPSTCAETISRQHRRELGREVGVTGHRARGGRARGRTRASRPPCCTRASPCPPCSRACPRRPWRPRDAGRSRPSSNRRVARKRPFVRRHHVTRPLAEPRDIRRPPSGRSASRSRTDLPRARAVPRRPASVAPAVRRRLAARARGGPHDRPVAAGSWSSNGAAAAVTSCASSPRLELRDERSRRPHVLEVALRPRAASSRRSDAPVPGSTRPPAGSRNADTRPRTTNPLGSRLDLGIGAGPPLAVDVAATCRAA